jgi:hypothetical protein
MLKALVLYFDQQYFEFIKCLSLEAVVKSCILEMWDLLIIDTFSIVSCFYLHLFRKHVGGGSWFFLLVGSSDAALHCPLSLISGCQDSIRCHCVCPLQVLRFRKRR